MRDEQEQAELNEECLDNNPNMNELPLNWMVIFFLQDPNNQMMGRANRESPSMINSNSRMHIYV